VEHHDLVLSFLRFQIDQFDYFHKKAKKYSVDVETTSKHPVSHAEGKRPREIIPTVGANPTIILGAKQKVSTIRELIEDQSADHAFTAFRSRVSSAIQALSSESGDTNTVNDSHQVCSLISFMSYYMIYTRSFQIMEYRYMKVKYESVVDWHPKTDYLQCNPKFNNRPRYDFVIVNSPRGCYFAQLVSIFVCCVNGHDYHLTLVQPLAKNPRAPARSVDRHLSIYRWHIQPRNRCEVIPLERIVRGAVLIADTRYAGDYFVVDTLDADMFMRVGDM